MKRYSGRTNRRSKLLMTHWAALASILFCGCSSAQIIEDAGASGENGVAKLNRVGVAYTLSIPAPEAELVNLSIETTCSAGEADEEPSFSIRRDYAALRGLDRFVANVRAWADGQPVEVRRVALDRWKVKSSQCSHLRLEYDILLSHREVLGEFGHRPGLLEVPMLERDWAFFLGYMVFLAPDHMEDEACRLSIDAPAGWQIAALWPIEEDGSYRAGSIRELQSSYFAAGELVVREEDVAKMPVTVAYADGRADSVWVEKLVDGIFSTARAQIGLMGRAPRPSWLVLVNFLGDSSAHGGSVRQDSIILHFPASLNASLVNEKLQLVAHEWFHGFQLAHPAEDDCQWLHEGFTDWMALVTLYEAGLMEREEWVRFVGSKLLQAEADARRAGRVTLLEASTGFYADANQRRFSYSGGTALAFRLDGLLRAAGDDRGLTGYLERLFGEWAKDRETYTLEDVLELAAEHGGEAWADEWRRLLESQGIPDLTSLVADTHCHVEEREVQQVRLPIGWKVQRGEPAVVLTVAAASYIEAAGLRAGDTLISINGIEIGSKADYDRALRIIEDPLRLQIVRDDERLELKIEPELDEVVEPELHCP